MVLSKINSEISYQELKTIDENDKGRDVSMYQINLFKFPVIVALGEIKYTFVEQNILFAPVYLVVDEHNKIYQVGVYEFPSEQLENLKDDDGDLDISLIDGPLLYSFVDTPYIKQCMKNENLVADEDSGDDEVEKDDDDEDEEELEDLDDDDDDDDEDENEEVKKGLKNPPPVLVELQIEDDDDDFLRKGEEEKDDKKERKAYKKPGKSDSQWIEHFMHNNNYGIKDNPGHGDCFFYTIRDAYKSIGMDANVSKTRDILTEKVDDAVFNNYKERYDLFNNELTTLKRQLPNDKKRKAKLAKEYNKLAREVKKEKDVPTKKQKTKKAKEMKKKHKAIGEEVKLKERELAAAKANFTDIAWFKNITNKEQLIAKMKTCDFWADVWAITTLEIGLNTKFIILSSDEYRHGNYAAVLRCGDMVPNSVEEKTYFKPKYYIMVEHTGNHYKLITYKDKQIFRFHEIPFSMKTKVVEKCMKSRGKSLYNYIPKFAKLIGETIVIPTEEKGEEKKIDAPVIVVETETEADPEEEIVMQTPTPDDENLFNDDTVFYFHSGSANKKPGKATGKSIHEKIKDEDVAKFKELEKMKDWRKVLSNMHTNEVVDGKVEPLFELDGLKWASVEHYYHANKFKKNNPDYYRLFSIDSGSQFAFDPKKALGAGGKTGKVRVKDPETKKVKIVFSRPRDIVMDADFEDGDNKQRVMEKGQQAKYEQDDLSRRVLLATKDAKLVHYIKSRGAPKEPVTFYDTMRIRHRLKKRN
tara:strand:- start:10362 stop:12623 length:2262 start_codon:yes stop_codon:yes gene_type:complete